MTASNIEPIECECQASKELSLIWLPHHLDGSPKTNPIPHCILRGILPPESPIDGSAHRRTRTGQTNPPGIHLRYYANAQSSVLVMCKFIVYKKHSSGNKGRRRAIAAIVFAPASCVFIYLFFGGVWGVFAGRALCQSISSIANWFWVTCTHTASRKAQAQTQAQTQAQASQDAAAFT